MCVFLENEEYERVHKSLQSLCQQGFLDGVTTTLTRVSHKPAIAASEETQRLSVQVFTVPMSGLILPQLNRGSVY